jgi:capsular polysaccharide biosynthesis protein
MEEKMSAENRKPVEMDNSINGKNNKLPVAGTEDKDTEIDLLDLANVLLDKIHFIIMFLLVGAVVCNAYAYFCIKPTYESTSKLYVVSASDDSVVNLSDLNIGTSLTADYEELMLSYPVLNQVIEKLDLNMTSTQLSGMISLTNPSDTRVLRITVTSTDPEQARDIANTLADVSVEYLPETMSTHAPNIAQVAKLPEHKAGPSYMKYTMIGGLAGALIYCIILVIGYLLDDTIHTAADMEKYFGIVPLTSIPESDKLYQEDGESPQGSNSNGRKGKTKGR